MLILHVITGLKCGGAEKQLAELVLQSDRGRFRHVVISLLEGGVVAEELLRRGIEVRSLGMHRRSTPIWGIVKLRRVIKQLKPDVVHCWLYHACLIGLLCSCLSGGTRVIWGLRSVATKSAGYRFSTMWVVRLCARLSGAVDCIVFNSEEGRRVHCGLGYSDHNVKTIENGVDTARFHPDVSARYSVRRMLGLPADAMLIGMYAGYRPAKDHETFAQAANIIVRKRQGVVFLLAGEGIDSLNRDLVTLLEKNNLKPHVHLLGPRRDMETLNAALDVASLSSRSESFPNAILEAMACGVPCVATQVGDMARIIGDTGLVVPPQDAQALADAWAALLRLPLAERQRLGMKARSRIVQNFAMQTNCRSYEDLYMELLRTGSACGSPQTVM